MDWQSELRAIVEQFSSREHIVRLVTLAIVVAILAIGLSELTRPRIYIVHKDAVKEVYG